MSHFRRLLGVLVLVILLAAGGWVVSGPAGADLQEVITIQEGQTIRRSYPPLGAADPSGASGSTPPFADPASCADAPGHVCDLIPIHLGEPSDPEEYLVRIKVTFKTEPLANGVLGSNDIDIYLWNDPPRDRMEDPDEEDPDPNPDEVQHSAGTSGTESVGIDSDPDRKFSLLVYHAFGTDEASYNVELRYFGGAGVRPDESLDPNFVPDLSGGSTTPAPPATRRPQPELALGGGLDVGPGDDVFDPGAPFADLYDPQLSGLDRAGRTGSSNPFAPRAARTVATPDPVSGATVALWMTLIPTVLLAAGAFWVRRHRPAALLVR